MKSSTLFVGKRKIIMKKSRERAKSVISKTSILIPFVFDIYPLDIYFFSKLALELIAIVGLEQNLTVRVRVHCDCVQRVQLAGTVEHIFIHFAVVATE